MLSVCEAAQIKSGFFFILQRGRAGDFAEGAVEVALVGEAEIAADVRDGHIGVLEKALGFLDLAERYERRKSAAHLTFELCGNI